ncbi:MAG: hypothetical protein Q8R36_00770 [bacterium]|nr:hypothetical protein [bacterium]
MKLVYTKNILLLLTFGIAIFALSFFAYAQTIAPSLSLGLSPAQPGANTEVVATIQSAFNDLSTARISWTLNGKITAEGDGITTFRFTTGVLGTVSRVSTVVLTKAGEKLGGSFEIRPAEVDVMWEALTYKPPFYKGKSVATSGSKIRVSAIPHMIIQGEKVSPEKLTYTWQQNRNVLGSLSGVGKQSVIIDAPYPHEETYVAVQISSPDGKSGAQKGITIATQNPQIVLYEKSPSEGVKYENALPADFNLAEEEITIRAEPYFFSTEDLSGKNVSFVWSLNSKEIKPATRINEITLRKESGEGIAQLELVVKNAAKALQEAVARMSIQF